MREWSLSVRVCCVFVLTSLFFFTGTANPSKPFSGVPLVHSVGHPSQSHFPVEFFGQLLSSHPQTRMPDTPITVPGTWAQSTKKHPVEPAQLKSSAQELAKLAETVPAQIDQVAKGQLPKELIANLKKIEKLSKQLRGEVAP
jgi:hypothetical protein